MIKEYVVRVPAGNTVFMCSLRCVDCKPVMGCTRFAKESLKKAEKGQEAGEEGTANCGTRPGME